MLPLRTISALGAACLLATCLPSATATEVGGAVGTAQCVVLLIQIQGGVRVSIADDVDVEVFGLGPDVALSCLFEA